MNAPVRVLLVDDEEDFLATMSFWLTSKGYQVNSVTSGAAAVDLIKAGGLDVVFLDVVMPKPDGIETLRRIRTFNKRIPVILVTTSPLTDKNQYAGAMKLGISGVFPKGSSPDHLGKVLQTALRRIRRAPKWGGDAAGPSGLGRLLSPIRALLDKLTPRAR